MLQVATGDFVGNGFAEEVAIALEIDFLDTGKPRDLTLIYVAGQGDGRDRGLNQWGIKVWLPGSSVRIGGWFPLYRDLLLKIRSLLNLIHLLGKAVLSSGDRTTFNHLVELNVKIFQDEEFD